MLFDFQYVELFPLTFSGLLGNLLTAFVCGLIISFVYRLSHKGGYSVTFVNSLIILPIITSVVILLIGNNIARAFGLVGAMSIIRFRTALRDTQDIIFIFFALAVGMAAGVNLDFTAILATFVIGLVVFVVIKFNPGEAGRSHLLQIRYGTSQENEVNLGTLLSTYCSLSDLKSYERVADVEELLSESVYEVQLKKGKSSAELVQQLNQLVSNCNVTAKALDANGKVIKQPALRVKK
ncbi:DUF4956 domain-containing protein [Botryobacter ruber]|uniref:DUF4956 domain-containing protein n=1 Tax=Botryobacter ruber TaxID=2171629 RepID=UPI0013E2F86F|nr:DUF4956 domain-containing protein [Botryobacter ruber]